MNAYYREAADLGTELTRLLDDIGDPILIVALSFAAMVAKNETAEMAEVLRLSQRVIDLADGDLAKGNLIVGSPLASAIAARGHARWLLGLPGWRDDFQQSIALSRGLDATTLSGAVWYTYLYAVPHGAMVINEAVLRDSAEALAVAEQSGDDLALDLAQTARGVILLHHESGDRQAGLDLLEKTRQRAMNERFALSPLAIADIHIARERLRSEDLDGAVDLSRTVLDDQFRSGSVIWSALATTVLVEALIQRSGDRDLADAYAALDRLSSVSTDPGFVLYDITLLRLRALASRAEGDDPSYRHWRDSYRKMATGLGFEGQMAWAEAMP